MLVPRMMALAVVTGGIALGAALGAFANPEMKMPPPQPSLGALQAPVAADAGYLLVEVGPTDLSPYQDSYAPTWADEELADWEPDYPAWTYSDLVSEMYEGAPAAGEPRADEQPVPVVPDALAPPEAATPPVEPAPPAPAPYVAGNLAALY